MQKGKELFFDCLHCREKIFFSLFEIEKKSEALVCSSCGKRYAFHDEVLLRQLRQFEALCRQIHASEEILGNTQVGVDVEGHQVKIPFKLLLTRLNPSLTLIIGNTPVVITFRMEPILEMTEKSHERTRTT